jgi:hypothetical protein
VVTVRVGSALVRRCALAGGSLAGVRLQGFPPSFAMLMLGADAGLSKGRASNGSQRQLLQAGYRALVLSARVLSWCARRGVGDDGGGAPRRLTVGSVCCAVLRCPSAAQSDGARLCLRICNMASPKQRQP